MGAKTKVRFFNGGRDMSKETLKQIAEHIASLPDAKQIEVQQLHDHMLSHFAKTKLWFLDGKDASGKVVTNPNIGYGSYTMHLAGGKTREFYRVGISANTGGISVYIMGHKDKNHLKEKYADSIGKATVTGYCIKFKKLNDIQLDVLTDAMKEGMLREE